MRSLYSVRQNCVPQLLDYNFGHQWNTKLIADIIFHKIILHSLKMMEINLLDLFHVFLSLLFVYVIIVIYFNRFLLIGVSNFDLFWANVIV